MRAATYSSAPPCSKDFLAFLASSACQPSATSYHSCSAAPLPWPSAFWWAAPFVRRGKAAQEQRAKRLLLRPTRMLQCFHSPSGHIAPQFAFGLVALCRSGRFRQSAVSKSHTGGRGHTGGAVQQTAPIWQQALPSLQDCPGLASDAQPALASDCARSASALRHAPTLPLQSL